MKLKTTLLDAVLLGGFFFFLLPLKVTANETNAVINTSSAADSSTPNPVIVPVWEDIANRYTTEDLFQKIIGVANSGLMTPEKIQNIFGIKFKAPYRDKGVGRVYIAEEDNTKYGTAFKFSIEEKQKEWTLRLSGFSAGKSTRECIHIKDALTTILNLGWQALRLPEEDIAYEYRKENELMSSLLNIGNSYPGEENNCLQWIQFTNRPKVAAPSQDN